MVNLDAIIVARFALATRVPTIPTVMAYTDMALMDVTPHAIAIGALGGLTGQTQTQIILVPAPATCAALIAHVHVVKHVHNIHN